MKSLIASITAIFLGILFDMDYINEYGFSKKVQPSNFYQNYTTEYIEKSKLDGAQKIVVTSTKELKIEVARKIISKICNKSIPIIGIKANSDIAEQPIGLANGILGAKNRIANISTNEPDIIYISIENYIESPKDREDAVDFALVRIEYNKTVYNQISLGVTIPKAIYEAATKNNHKSPTGFDKTIGQYYADHFGFNPYDWHQSVILPIITRQDQIFSSIRIK